MSSGNRLPYYRLTYTHGFRKKKTISGYRVGYVFMQLHYSILNGVLRQVVYWVSELVCSGYTDQLWEFVFQFYSMYVHIYFPNLIIDISSKFKEYVYTKSTTRVIEIRNQVSVRDSFYRIMYIFTTMSKRFIVSLFQDGLFRSLHLTDDMYARLDLSNNTSSHFRHRKQSVSGSDGDRKKKRIEQYHHSIHQNLIKIEYYFKKCRVLVENKKVGETTYTYVTQRIYEIVSVLLEYGMKINQVMGGTGGDSSRGVEHCNGPSKDYYFIWILWNLLLNHSKEIKFPLHSSVKETYKIYESTPKNQSPHAYYMLVATYRMVLNHVDHRNVYINQSRYNKYHRKFYKCFGYIEEGVQNKEPRRDMRGL